MLCKATPAYFPRSNALQIVLRLLSHRYPLAASLIPQPKTPSAPARPASLQLFTTSQAAVITLLQLHLARPAQARRLAAMITQLVPPLRQST